MGYRMISKPQYGLHGVGLYNDGLHIMGDIVKSYLK